MSTKTYKAPVDGYYMVSQNIAYYTPTGMMETVPNPDRRWWEFWKPATITRAEYVVEWRPTGTKIVLLKQGEEVVSSIGIQRL